MHPLYQHAARVYDRLLPFFSLGAAPVLRRAATRASGLSRGATVVDVGCGTGLLLPLLRAQVGPRGRVIGVDLTAPMLARARERVRTARWDNVDLHHADMADFDPGIEVDAAVFSLSLSAADPREVLSRVLRYVRPGGRIVVVDPIPAAGRLHHPLVNLVGRVRAPLVGSDVARAVAIVHAARERLHDVRREVRWGGLYTILSGRVPVTSGAPS